MPRAKAGPRFIPPQLATLAAAVPDGPRWIHEVKYDGYRLEALIGPGGVRLMTRKGLDWTHRFPAIAAAAGHLTRGVAAVLDGEVVAVDGRGRSSFQGLQERLNGSGGEELRYRVFDLLQENGEDLRSLPLHQRRARLVRLIRRAPARFRRLIAPSEVLSGRADRLLAKTVRMGLEGLISKDLGAPYASGRTRSWLKIKSGRRQEFVIVGFTPPKGSRSGLGALLLATYQPDGSLRYAGRVGTGFSRPVLRGLREQLDRNARATSPLPTRPALFDPGTMWVRPRLVAEVSFAEWTADGLLRHPAFLGLREDKSAQQVQREDPMPETVVAGVPITHPDRIVYPGQRISKLAVARYYERVAARMLPHLAGRPLSFLRCPEGIRGECFFQKHWTGTLPAALDTVLVAQRGSRRPYVVVDDAEGLVTLAQWGILEIHLLGARAARVEFPDRVVFDLDPGPGVRWTGVRAAARSIRQILTGAGLASRVKTSGGKGLHVVAALDGRSRWEEVSAFARAVAERLEEEEPERYVSKAGKTKRQGKIFIDWLRNTRGATWVAPWSLRARAGAPISMPVSWSGLARVRAGDQFTLAQVGPALRRADPWKGFGGSGRRG